jgi:hypothetical protein
MITISAAPPPQCDDRVAGKERATARPRREELLRVLGRLLGPQPQGGEDPVCRSTDREEVQLGRQEDVAQRGGVPAHPAQHVLGLRGVDERADVARDGAEDEPEDEVGDRGGEEATALEPPRQCERGVERGRAPSRSGTRAHQASAEVAPFGEGERHADGAGEEGEGDEHDDEPVGSEDLELLGPADR